jgi:hypothetical protein
MAFIVKQRGLPIYKTIMQPLRKLKLEFKLFYEGEQAVIA